MSNLSQTWDEEFDVVVVGSGCAGMVATVLAAKKSLKVVLCEKTEQVGGTTATSGGVVWIPNSQESKAAGVVDSPEQVRTYLRNKLGNYYQADLADAYIEAAPRAAAAVQQDTDIKFQLMPTMSDYQASLPGGMAGGRALEPVRFDGRRLGTDFERVRPPIKRLMLFGGLYFDKRRVDDFLNPFRSFGNFWRVCTTLARYGADRLRFSRGTDIGAGNALIAAALLSLRKRKIPIWFNSSLVDLIGDERDGISGAIIRRDGKSIRVRARKGVILAAGGFARNPNLVTELAPDHPHDQSVSFEGNVGDALTAARKAGAAVDTELSSPCWWTPTSKYREKDGTIATILYGYLDRGRPGIIAVDRNGKRFVNESNSYHDIVVGMFKTGVDEDSSFYLVCDRRFIWRRGIGMIRPFTWSLRHYLENGYLQTGRTVRELAARIGVDPDALEQTVRRHNDFAATGVDLDFGKGSDPYNRQFGDPAVKPNPNLAPIEHGPFFALRIYPASLGTTVGLKTNADAQVIGNSGRAISGLYACGNDAGSVWRGFYPGGGSTLGPGLVFAYRAIERITLGSLDPAHPQKEQMQAT